MTNWQCNSEVLCTCPCSDATEAQLAPTSHLVRNEFRSSEITSPHPIVRFRTELKQLMNSSSTNTKNVKTNESIWCYLYKCPKGGLSQLWRHRSVCDCCLSDLALFPVRELCLNHWRTLTQRALLQNIKLTVVTGRVMALVYFVHDMNIGLHRRRLVVD